MGRSARTVSVVIGIAFVVASEYAVLDRIRLRSTVFVAELILVAQLDLTQGWILYPVLAGRERRSSLLGQGSGHRTRATQAIGSAR